VPHRNVELELALRDGGGVLARRDHVRLVPAIDHALRAGRLRALLPGVYVGAGAAPDLVVRARALMAWSPDAVLTGRAAARLAFWPDLAVVDVEAAARRVRAQTPGYQLERRAIDPELVLERDGLRLTRPALTALDLCSTLGGDAIDTVLRSGSASLAELHSVLDRTGKRRGNDVRRRLLLDSRDEPWSEAERRAHRLLRDAGLAGWVTNHPVHIAGARYYLDIAFPGVMLAIEIDGRVHDRYDAFEYDRARQNDLVLQGWRVLRFTWSMLVERPEAVLLAIHQALATEK
jgi:very-short-patch-repair endonuclease